MKALTPTFWRPTELSIPLGVSHKRGEAAPWIGSREMPLVTKPPILLQVDEVGEFEAVTEGTAGSNDGIAKTERADVDAKVDGTSRSHSVVRIPRFMAGER